jgi:chromosome segregation ATPase
LRHSMIVLLSLRARGEYETKIHALESLLVGKGMSMSEIAAVVQSSTGLTSSTSSNGSSSMEHDVEIARLNDKLSEQHRLVTILQRQIDEYGDLEESKTNFEEYEHNVRQELEDELLKFEDEKQTLQNERFKLLKDRSSIDEKESRIGLLITNLDEKESKLRQLMASMKEQQEQWQRSVNDLQRREGIAPQ